MSQSHNPTTGANDIMDDAGYLIYKGVNNSRNFIRIFNEFHKSRNFATLKIINPNMFDELIRVYNQYILGNGLFVKSLMKFGFNEYQSFCFNILTRNPQKYGNHWYTYISNYIFSKYNEDITSIELEELNDIRCYYSEQLSRRVKKLVKEPPKINKTDIEIKDMNKLIKIGETIRYDCVGFYNNELLYLLSGLCINEGIKREFNSFYSLFKFVKSYLQLWQFNKIYEFRDGESHNLVTHIKCDGKYVKRYKGCRDYFEEYDFKNPPNKTKYIEDKNKDKVYIQTDLTTQEINDIWITLETLYKDGKILDLYYFYVTSQLLTRSTCLSALIILQIMYYKKNNKFIKVRADDQLDWFAISKTLQQFKEQFNEITSEVELETSDVDVKKVGDILNYTHYYIASNLSR